MKKFIFLLFVALPLYFSLTQCQEKVEQDLDELVPVEFVLNNPVMDESGNRTAGGPKDENIPVCREEIPAYVYLEAIFPNLTRRSISLDVLKNFKGGTQTVVVKLPPGKYEIKTFLVLDGESKPLFASPIEGSYYDKLFGFENNLPLTFVVEPFTKKSVAVDVLCWEDYSYKDFGYEWFDFEKFKVRTLCFFGDVCTKFFDKWHAEEKGNPYLEQKHDGYDFPAIFKVVIVDANGDTVNVADNTAWQGTGEPLCIEYLDDESVDETFTAHLWLYMPDGTMAHLEAIDFDDSAHSDGDNPTWGGDDGIYRFAVGAADACLDQSVDVFYNLPWVPLPGQVEFTLLYPWETSYFGLGNIKPIGGIRTDHFVPGANLDAWCGNKDWTIEINKRYIADVYPYFNIPKTAPQRFRDISIKQWNMINWIANEVIGGPHPSSHIQNAIWEILGFGDLEDGGIVAEAENHKNYMVPPGGFIVVLIDPGEDIQLVFVRFYP